MQSYVLPWFSKDWRDLLRCCYFAKSAGLLGDRAREGNVSAYYPAIVWLRLEQPSMPQRALERRLHLHLRTLDEGEVQVLDGGVALVG